MDNRFQDLSEKVLEWADDKGILDKANPWDQAQKMREEALELADEVHLEHSLNVESCGKLGDGWSNLADMEAGDVFVTLIILCWLRDANPMDCLEKAYNKISKREGRMVGGQFVKQEDL
jgi:hypothetical protein